MSLCLLLFVVVVVELGFRTLHRGREMKSRGDCLLGNRSFVEEQKGGGSSDVAMWETVWSVRDVAGGHSGLPPPSIENPKNIGVFIEKIILKRNTKTHLFISKIKRMIVSFEILIFDDFDTSNNKHNKQQQAIIVIVIIMNSGGHDDNRKQTQTQRQAPIRTLVEEPASEGNYCDFLFLSDGSFISAVVFSNSSGNVICKRFTLKGRLTRTFSSRKTSALSRRRKLLWVEQDVTFLCCSLDPPWIDVFSVNSSKPLLNAQFDLVHTVKIIDESFQLRHLFLSSTHTGSLRVWELVIEEPTSKRKKKKLNYFDITWLKSDPIFWYQGYEQTSLCALKGGRFVEVNTNTDTITLWEKTSSSTLLWQRTKVFRSGDRLVKCLNSFEIYNEMVAICGLSCWKLVKFHIVVLDPSGNSSVQRNFRGGDCTIDELEYFTCNISLWIKDSVTQLQTQKRLICCLSQNGCLWFWDINDGTLVKKVHSEQLSTALCMSSASGDSLLLVARVSEERHLFMKRIRLQITVVDVLQLIYGDAVIASTSPVPPSSLIPSIHDCEMAKRLSFGHLKTVTSLEVMEDGMVLSGSLDGIIKLWSPDTQRVIRSFYMWLSTPTTFDIKFLKSVGEGWFVSVSVNQLTIRAKYWSVNQSEDCGAQDVVISLKPSQWTKELRVLDSNTMCVIDGGECQVWSLTDGSLKHVFGNTTKIRKIDWLADLGIRHTYDGQQQHLVAAGCNDSKLAHIWDVISLQVVTVLNHQFEAYLHISQVVAFDDMEAMIGYGLDKGFFQVEWNLTTGSSQVSEIPNGSFEKSNKILLQRSCQGPSSTTETHFLKLGDGTIGAVQDRIIKILSRNGRCHTYGLLLAARITSVVELTNRSLTFGLDDGRIVTLNRLSR